MKTFSTLITESNINIPQFKHGDLNNPRDPEGKFWKALEAANDDTGTPKGTYAKAIKLAKDLYSLILDIDNANEDVMNARAHASGIVSDLEKASAGSIEATSFSDQKFLRNCIHIIQTADEILSHKRFYKESEVDVKAGYVPFRGAAKDPKIKYRVVVRCKAPITDPKAISKSVVNASPIIKDYVAGIEWNKECTAFAILITNSPGYKR